jgi:glucosylglycerate synthase
LADEILLADDFIRQLMSVGEVDLLVGIPTHNCEKTIGDTVATIERAFQEKFPRERVVIVGVDGGSTDNTWEAMQKSNSTGHQNLRGITTLRTIHRIVTRYDSVPVPGTAMRTTLAAADLLRAKACAVVSPNSVNMTSEWVEKLLEPVYRQNVDFVAPIYSRHKYDGLLARILLYPMTRAAFGSHLYELQSDEFAFSGRLATDWLNQEVWHTEAVREAPQTWMAIAAVSKGYKSAQTLLGPKIRPAEIPAPDIVTVVRQVVGALFWCLEIESATWINRMETQQPAPARATTDGHQWLEGSDPINSTRIWEMFKSGISELTPVLQSIVTKETLSEIEQTTTLDELSFRISHELWAKAVYEFAASYHWDVLSRDHVVQALVPLYRGKISSYLLRHENSSFEQVEADSEEICAEFEKQKPYLIERWKVK